ncbi:MAG: hypothetical protein OXF00_03235 [bacterium]|nr:hypothetical protein [bacterium]
MSAFQRLSGGISLGDRCAHLDESLLGLTQCLALCFFGLCHFVLSFGQPGCSAVGCGRCLVGAFLCSFASAYRFCGKTVGLLDGGLMRLCSLVAFVAGRFMCPMGLLVALGELVGSGFLLLCPLDCSYGVLRGLFDPGQRRGLICSRI